MNDFENQKTMQSIVPKRRASWAAGIFTALGLAFFGVSIYIVFGIQDGRFDLSDKVLMPVAALMFVFSLASLILLRRDRFVLGTALIFAVSLLPPIVATLFLTDFGIISIVFILVLVPILIFQILPTPSRVHAVISTLVAIVSVIGIEFWDPAFRTSPTILSNFVFVVVPIAAVGLFAFYFRLAWKGNLRNKLIFSLILVSVIPLLVVGTVFGIQIFNAQLPQALEQQSQIAYRIAEQTETFIRARESELRALIDFRSLAGLSLEEQTHLLSSLLSAQNLYDEIILVDGKGQEQVYLSRVDIITADDLVSRVGADEFESPKTTDETYFSSVQFDEVTGEPNMVIAIPVSDLRSGQLNNVLIANFRFKTVWDLMAQPDVVGAGIVYMVDNSNKVVAHANPSVVLQGTEVELPLEDSFTAGIDGDEVAMSLAPISLSGQAFTVVTELPRSEAMALANSTLTITVVVIVVAIVIAAGFGAFVSQNVTMPIIRLTEVAQKFAGGELTARANVESQDEVGTLATTFNTMAAELRGTLSTLEQRVAERTRALATSTEVSRQLSTILNQDELVSEVVEQVRSAFDYYHAHIYLLDEAGKNLQMVGGTGDVGQTMLERGHNVALGQGLVGRAAESNQVVLVSNVAQEDGWLPNPLLPETRAEVAVPIAIGDAVLGVLDVQDNEIGGLSQEDADLLSSISNQVAVALQNTQAYRDAQARAKRETLMVNINQQIVNTTTVEDALKVAVREMGRALNTETRVKLHSNNS